MTGRRSYPSYKETSIPWLATIPMEWDVLPLFFAAAEQKHKNIGMREKNLLSLSYGRIVKRDINSNEGLLPESFETYQIVDRSDIVLRMTDLQNDQRSLRSALVRERGIITSAYIAVRPKGINPSFLGYLIRAYDVQKVFYAMGGGLRQSLKFEELRRLPLVIPSESEQSAIVRFLDRETDRIDALIAKKTRFIELMKEKRQAVITKAVTKGLDDSVAMKDSKVFWIGKTPAHWAVCKLSYRYSVELGKMLDEKKLTGLHPVPYLRNKDVQWEEINSENLPFMDIAPNERDRYTVRSGDLLVCEGGDVGRAAIWRGADNLIGYQKALHRLRSLSPDRDLAEFYLYSLFAAKKLGLFEESDTKSTISHLPAEKFREYKFSFPPFDEQVKILAYLRESTARIDTLIAKTERSIELLKEHRAALITAAVSGKIDVREAA